ncbi:MAG: hypothetical protein J6Z24_06875 [Oscillospiraceae bacterium]|nr:hypothetical protein [Oscillospiraceae bacterium]
MKKTVSILLLIILLVTMSSCGKKTDPSPADPSPSPSPSVDPGPETDPGPGGGQEESEAEILNKLYSDLGGVWVHQEEESGDVTFLAISMEDGKVCYTAGIPESEFMFGGPVDTVKKNRSGYSFTVHVPEVADNDEFEGHAAYDLDVTVEYDPVYSYRLNAEDHAGTGARTEFSYFCDDLGNADWGALRAGNEPMPGFNSALAADLWGRISGIWLVDQDYEEYFFSSFTVEDGQYCVSQGILASGYMLGGTVTDIRENGGIYEMTIYVPKVEESEMDSGHDAFSVEARLSIEDDSRIMFTCFAGGGEYCQWRFSCLEWESFDWGAIYGHNIEQAWYMLDGAWVGKNENGTTLSAYFYSTASGDHVVSLGIPFTGPAMSGTVSEFEDRTSDSTFWPRIDLADSDRSMYIMIDYSSVAEGRIVLTDFFDSGKPVTLEYKAPDPQQLTEDMMP